ncbi:hypothetical protein AB3Y40_18985 [Yoonia sp. R2331]|uniref:hypothetical protein n=1 Tax=Yoonia sp. R2331 TaxID=3237238 RepID=UPI0034E420B7
MTNLRKLHRTTAMILATYIAAHLGNHLLIFLGTDWHLWAMEGLRVIYRNPVVEPLLLAAFAIQIALGLRLLWQRGWPKRFWPRLQIASGAVLALFLMQHIGATLATRMSYAEIDTNVFWAAAVVDRAPFVWYFAPYYTLGVAALFAHLAVVLHRYPAQRKWAVPVLVLGFATGAAIVAALMSVTLPPAYDAYLTDFWF